MNPVFDKSMRVTPSGEHASHDTSLSASIPHSSKQNIKSFLDNAFKAAFSVAVPLVIASVDRELLNQDAARALILAQSDCGSTWVVFGVSSSVVISSSSSKVFPDFVPVILNCLETNQSAHLWSVVKKHGTSFADALRLDPLAPESQD